MTTDLVNQKLDTFTGEIGENWHALLLAQATLQLGEGMLNTINDNANLEVRIGSAIQVEPIPIGELRQYGGTFPDFILQAFHGRAITLWQDLLQSIFEVYLEWHFQGTRQFTELKARQLTLDFTVGESFGDQIKARLKSNFSFDKYKSRYKLINSIRNQNNSREAELYEIHKHVSIRNSFQHHDGIIDGFSLQNLGRTRIELLEADGQTALFGQGDRLRLSIPEFDKLQKSLLLVVQAWRS